MDTLIALAITLLVLLFFALPHWRKAAAQSPKQAHVRVCPRCGSETDSLSALCTHCRSPLEVWAGKSDGEAPVNDSGEPRPVVNASLCIGCGACVEACPEKGTLEIVGGKAILAHPDRCKSHGDCVSSCPTSAIVLLTGDAKQTIRVPETNADFESNVPGVFIIGELGGLGLIKTAINEGCQVAETIRKRLKNSLPPLPPASYDVIIVGAGPSGLSAALTFHKYQINYLTLEQGEIASTVRNYPRKKFLMEEPVQVPLFGKLMMKDGSKEDLLEVWDRIVNDTGVKVNTNHRVESVERTNPDGPFAVTTSLGVFQARFVVLATGKRGSPRKLDVPGEELSKVTYRLIEAESYTDCDVTVAGGGDSAVEAALALSRSGTNRVTLIHRRQDFARLRDRNRTKLAEAEQSGSISVLRNAQIKQIVIGSLTVETPKGITNLKNDYLFVLIGGESPDAFLGKVGVQIIERIVAA